ncbi:nucleoside triphosphate pyrophosphohydrolase [Bergeyella cardium]|uniref:Nucleoside triphosphate pyrophosphohydrolase n=1 Tax=Bergeyella cardium TaxID=1585976 RepID=A0A6P1QXZ2_9FLAO|nr:nucleoside triphosphate pyrophosphohydrolase [Bergeyella cardium]QHN65590.1 nucleoside triphosphate pyrophosphohydrolase [Bergeyella cardium]WHE33177.1 nucleoside triphosphate pyrophosphohydrolase [Bergeyella cardium]WHF59827.1 nucleoside triphosphate pyrophosphohydrolase [Bergeyella cardium]
MNTKQEKIEAFGRLLDIMDELREKCPWDRKQTLQTLRHLTLEETYELTDALLNEDLPEIKKELGDVLLHLIFYSKIASEKKAFDIADVINSLNEKLIFRHPHIYADTQVSDEEEVKQNWEKLKLKEGNKSILSGVPKGLPSLIKAYRIQDKVRGVGFDFPNADEAWQKVEEEIREMKAETDTQKKEEELGDVLFSIINYSRIAGINPDAALERTNAKFISRFQEMEKLAADKRISLADQPLPLLDELWNTAKQRLKDKA